MDNQTKYEIMKKAPHVIELPFKQFQNPIINPSYRSLSDYKNMTDTERDNELTELELYEGPCTSLDFGKYHNKYIRLQESLIPFGKQLDYVRYSKGKWGRVKLLATTPDNSFTFEVNQQIHTNPTRIYVGKKMIKLGRWLNYTSETRQELYNNYGY